MQLPHEKAHEGTFVKHRAHTCPWWLAWALAHPVRRWFDAPERVLGDFVVDGDRVLELGPGAGYFTVPLLERVGPKGKVHCVDVQSRMLEMTKRKALRGGLGARIDTRLCTGGDLGLSDLGGLVDKAVLIYVLHEVPNPRATLAQVHAALRPGGSALLLEPRGHCSSELFAAELWAARDVGFAVLDQDLGAALAGRQAAMLLR